MLCKKIKQLLLEAQFRTLNETETSELETHLRQCPACFEDAKQNDIISSIFKESSEIYEEYIIPQDMMRVRVEKQLEKEVKLPFWSFFKNPLITSALTIVLLVVGFNYINNQGNTHTPLEYTVSLDGINVAMVEDHEILCDMLYTIGLPDASIDVLGCDTTCELVIYDLKTRQEAEKVVQIMHAIDKDLKNSDIIEVKKYNI